MKKTLGARRPDVAHAFLRTVSPFLATSRLCATASKCNEGTPCQTQFQNCEEAARMNRWPEPVPGYVTNNGMVMHWADRPTCLVRGQNSHPENRYQVWEQAAKVKQ